MKKRTLFAALFAAIAAAVAAPIAELPSDPAYPLAAGSALKAGEPVKLDANGRAVALGASGKAVALALGDATTNRTVTVKTGVFGLPAATNLTAALANGRLVGYAGGEVVASTNATLGRCLYLDETTGTAFVRIEP